MADLEFWLPVNGFEGFFEVSNRGRVRSMDRLIEVSGRCGSYSRVHVGRILKQSRHPRGYMYVSLTAGTIKRLNAKVHHLVLESFVGARPAGFDGCHANDIPDDNRLENLRWDTKSANAQDLVRNGRHAKLKKTHCAQGHAYTPENTLRIKRQNNARSCRVCRNKRAIARYHRMKAGS